MKNDVDYIVFLGDYFDCFETPDNKEYFGVQAVSEWLNQTSHELGNKAIWLCGNHDIAYHSSYIPNTTRIRQNQFYNCSGWTSSKASTINKYLDPSFFSNMELCCQVNGFTLSHAGFHTTHFQPNSTEHQNVQRLYDDWELTKQAFFNRAFHWIWDVGSYRGGDSIVGSPVWLEWSVEFEDIPLLPQIVGHTDDRVHRQRGNSYCIDANRTTYCVLEPQKTRPSFYVTESNWDRPKTVRLDK